MVVKTGKRFNMRTALGEDYQPRRIYVSNIPKNITEQELRNYFDAYGDLASCSIEEDAWKCSEKNGFVTFKDSQIVDYILTQRSTSLELNGSILGVKRATAEKSQLFVGGYDINVNEEQLRAFFSKYGQVTDVTMKYNSEGVSRCFGFVTLRDSEDAAKQLVDERFVPCLGKTVEIKIAKSGPKKKAYNKPSSSAYNSISRSSSVVTTFGPKVMKKASSSRFSRLSLEVDNLSLSRSMTSLPDRPTSPFATSRTPEARFTTKPYVRRNSFSTSTSSEEVVTDNVIEGTTMYSRKYFAPFRKGFRPPGLNEE